MSFYLKIIQEFTGASNIEKDYLTEEENLILLKIDGYKKNKNSWGELLESLGRYYQKETPRGYKIKSNSKWNNTSFNKEKEWLKALELMLSAENYSPESIKELEVFLFKTFDFKTHDKIWRPLLKEFPKISLSEKIQQIKNFSFKRCYVEKDSKDNLRYLVVEGKSNSLNIQVSRMWPLNVFRRFYKQLSSEDLWILIKHYRKDKKAIKELWSRNSKVSQERLLFEGLVGAKEEREYILGPHMVKNQTFVSQNRGQRDPEFSHMRLIFLKPGSDEVTPSYQILGRFPENYPLLIQKMRDLPLSLFFHLAGPKEEYFNLLWKVAMEKKEKLASDYILQHFIPTSATKPISGEYFKTFLTKSSLENKQYLKKRWMDFFPFACPEEWIGELVKSIESSGLSIQSKRQELDQSQVLTALRKRALKSSNTSVKLRAIFR